MAPLTFQQKALYIGTSLLNQKAVSPEDKQWFNTHVESNKARKFAAILASKLNSRRNQNHSPIPESKFTKSSVELFNELALNHDKNPRSRSDNGAPVSPLSTSDSALSLNSASSHSTASSDRSTLRKIWSKFKAPYRFLNHVANAVTPNRDKHPLGHRLAKFAVLTCLGGVPGVIYGLGLVVGAGHKAVKTLTAQPSDPTLRFNPKNASTESLTNSTNSTDSAYGSLSSRWGSVLSLISGDDISYQFSATDSSITVQEASRILSQPGAGPIELGYQSYLELRDGAIHWVDNGVIQASHVTPETARHYLESENKQSMTLKDGSTLALNENNLLVHTNPTGQILAKYSPLYDGGLTH